MLLNSGSYELLKIKNPRRWGGTPVKTMANTKMIELAGLKGVAFNSLATPELRAMLLLCPRAEHNGAYSNSPNSLAIKRAGYIRELLNGRVPANEKTNASLKALKNFMETFQIQIEYYCRYWNGTTSSNYPRVLIDGGTYPLYCQQVWTLSERFAHKLGQIWALEVKARPSLGKEYPLNSVAKVAPKPAPKAVAKPAPRPTLAVAPKVAPKPAPKAVAKAQDFKAVIKAMRAAEVSAELILKTLESL